MSNHIIKKLLFTSTLFLITACGQVQTTQQTNRQVESNSSIEITPLQPTTDSIKAIEIEENNRTETTPIIELNNTTDTDNINLTTDPTPPPPYIDNTTNIPSSNNTPITPTTPLIEEPISSNITINHFINYNNCDQVIEKDFSTGAILSICYDYGYKSATYVGYILDGTLVNNVNIKERPNLYIEPTIPTEYQVKHSDYTNSGYDRGHLAPDADFDYNQADLETIYTLANIVPQDPNVNRHYWTKAEAYEREMAYKLGELWVINGVKFENPIYIGENKIAVAKGFWKILWNEAEEFEVCFYYDNFVLETEDDDTLDKHIISCDLLM